MRSGLSVVELVVTAGLVGLLLGSALVMLRPGGPRSDQSVELERAGIVGRLVEPLTHDLRFSARIERLGSDRFRCGLRYLQRAGTASRAKGPETTTGPLTFASGRDGVGPNGPSITPGANQAWRGESERGQAGSAVPDREGVGDIEWVQWGLDASRRKVLRQARNSSTTFDFDPVLVGGEALKLVVELGMPVLVQLSGSTSGVLLNLDVCPLAIDHGFADAALPFAWSRLSKRGSRNSPAPSREEVRGDGLARPPQVVAGGRQESRRQEGSIGAIGRPLSQERGRGQRVESPESAGELQSRIPSPRGPVLAAVIGALRDTGIVPEAQWKPFAALADYLEGRSTRGPTSPSARTEPGRSPGAPDSRPWTDGGNRRPGDGRQSDGPGSSENPGRNPNGPNPSPGGPDTPASVPPGVDPLERWAGSGYQLTRLDGTEIVVDCDLLRNGTLIFTLSDTKSGKKVREEATTDCPQDRNAAMKVAEKALAAWMAKNGYDYGRVSSQ